MDAAAETVSLKIHVSLSRAPAIGIVLMVGRVMRIMETVLASTILSQGRIVV